jgi:transposase
MSRPFGYRKPRSDYRRQYANVLATLQQGYSLRKTAEICGVSVNTIRKIKAMFY